MFHRPLPGPSFVFALGLLASACGGDPTQADAGDITPDAGDVTPDAGETPAAPETTIGEGPSGETFDTAANFAFSCDSTGCTFECALDDGSFEACTSPKAYAALAIGTHTFRVRATGAGGTDATPASRNWAILTPPPDTTVTGGPEGTTHVISASFTLGCDKEGCTYECKLDDGAFEACTSPVTFDDVADGAHTFQARAIAGGATDATPASHTWTVNTSRQARKWIDRAGNIYVADTANCVVRKILAADGRIITVAGVYDECAGSLDGDGGAATAAALGYPIAVALGPNEDLYILEDGDRIRKVDHATGIITTVAGTGTNGEIADGSAGTSGQLSDTLTLTVDGAGNLYFGDRYRLRMLSASTGLVSTVAGGAGRCNPATAATGVLATEACFDGTFFGTAIGPTGRPFFASSNRAFRIEADGKLTHLAGNGEWGGGGSGGAAVDATMREATGLAVDADGNLFLAETYVHAVRKVSAATGVITAVAGIPDSGGTGGDGGAATAAQLREPGDISFDAAGNLYIVDSGNHVVRKVDHVTGTISLVAGTYVQGFLGDGAAATGAQFSYPAGMMWWWD